MTGVTGGEEKFGATHAFNSTKDDAAAKIREIVGPQGADVVVDTTGRARVIELAYELTHPGKDCGERGVARDGTPVVDPQKPVCQGQTVTGVDQATGQAISEKVADVTPKHQPIMAPHTPK